MPLDPEFRSLLIHRVSIAPFASLDDYGTPTYGTAVSVAARVEHQIRIIRDVTGRDVTSMALVILDSTSTIRYDSRLTMPDGTTPPILRLELMYDETSPHHWEIRV